MLIKHSNTYIPSGIIPPTEAPNLLGPTIRLDQRREDSSRIQVKGLSKTVKALTGLETFFIVGSLADTEAHYTSHPSDCMDFSNKHEPSDIDILIPNPEDGIPLFWTRGISSVITGSHTPFFHPSAPDMHLYTFPNSPTVKTVLGNFLQIAPTLEDTTLLMISMQELYHLNLFSSQPYNMIIQDYPYSLAHVGSRVPHNFLRALSQPMNPEYLGRILDLWEKDKFSLEDLWDRIQNLEENKIQDYIYSLLRTLIKLYPRIERADKSDMLLYCPQEPGGCYAKLIYEKRKGAIKASRIIEFIQMACMHFEPTNQYHTELLNNTKHIIPKI